MGQYLTCQINEVKNDGRVLRLCAKSSAVGRALAESKQGWTLTNLLPGLLVKATVRKVGRVLDNLWCQHSHTAFYLESTFHLLKMQHKMLCRNKNSQLKVNPALPSLYVNTNTHIRTRPPTAYTDSYEAYLVKVWRHGKALKVRRENILWEQSIQRGATVCNHSGYRHRDHSDPGRRINSLRWV